MALGRLLQPSQVPPAPCSPQVRDTGNGAQGGWVQRDNMGLICSRGWAKEAGRCDGTAP